MLFLLSLMVGLGSALGVWLFKRLIDLFHMLFFDDLAGALAPLGAWTPIVATVLGGLIVGWIMYRFVGEERHHGVAGIMESVAMGGGRLRYRRMPIKAVTAAMSIGAGASVGPEDPSVQIGANIGSFLGQVMKLSEERVRALVAAGAAGGIAAAFNAPIAAVFFAVEIVLGELSGSSLTIVVLSAVISAVSTQAISGREPAFHVPAYAFNSVFELPLYLVLGLFAGVLSVLYIRAIFAAHDRFAALKLPAWAKPALAGLIVGAVGLLAPQILGVGYETITTILAGSTLSIFLLVALLFAKLFVTPVSVGGGFPGGVFAPSLFLGALMGAIFGLACRSVFPDLNIMPQAFAMVGMAAVLAGTVHAPLTAILLLFEMTNDYRIILPLMFAVIISLLVSERLQRESVYTLSLVRKGIRLERGRNIEVLDGLKVEEVMSKKYPILHTTDTLQQVMDLFTRTRNHGGPVCNANHELVGMFTLKDLDKASEDQVDFLTETIGDCCTRKLIVAYPDEPLSTALRRMSFKDIGRLPVVERENPSHLLGLLRRSDVIRAYDIALTRRSANRHLIQSVRLGMLTQLPVEVARVEARSVAAGQLVSRIPWPQEAVIASVRRGSNFLIPHGETRIEEGDVVVFVTNSRETSAQVEALCAGPEDEDSKE
ncbi:MAG: chloride channel protein, partial [Anaerolineaceae bacterium]|nr:chloride channel protein [Anaerolineaceae bacterium]